MKVTIVLVTKDQIVLTFTIRTFIVQQKIDELSIHLCSNHIVPHLTCLTEHHLKSIEVSKYSIDGYLLATSFCRKESLGGGVCILINKNLNFHVTNLDEYCNEKSMEICAVKIQLFRVKLIIFCIYRTPSGNLKIFYDSLERILNHFQRPKVTYLICGDLNINFLNRTNYDTIKLEALLNTFNMKQVVNFPTRKNKNLGH